MNQIDPNYAYKTRREKRREKAFHIFVGVSFLFMLVMATLIFIKYSY